MSTSKFDHSEDRLRTLRRHTPVAAGNLYNAGLTLPGCVTAYQAALFCGASSEVAFEAARNHMLAELPPTLPEGRLSTYDLIAGRDADMARRVAARAELIERIRNLPNPFAAQPSQIDVAALANGMEAGNESAIEAALGVAA